MALKQSRMLELGTPAPGFSLPDPSGRIYTPDDFAHAKALLVTFICNHCPFVKHVLPGFVDFARDYAEKGLGVVAISPNDIVAYPQDGPQEMGKLSTAMGFTFPYLFDEAQAVAKAYQAECTPEFYLFDGERRLAYRGQFDSSRPAGRIPVTGADLRAAADAVLAGRPVTVDQTPSAGCSIKWKRGNEPDWA